MTITVHDENEALVENATVVGTWSGPVSGSSSCLTDVNGRCQVKSPKVPNGDPSVHFTVDDITHDTLSYDASANHDPDGDSDGTTIEVLRP